MLDFLLVLGQIPGTRIDLTFFDVLAGFCVIFILYKLYREHKLSKQALKALVVAFWLYVSRPKRGRPPKQVELWPDHTSSVPLINIDFGYLSRRWRLAR